MPTVEIPRSDRDNYKIVDVIGMLGDVLKNITGLVRNGPFIWANRHPDGSVAMSEAMASEVFKLAAVYRHYYRCMMNDPLVRPGLTMAEWTKMKEEAELACQELDRIYPGK